MQEWLELSNGCICCSVKYNFYGHKVDQSSSKTECRDSGVNAIESLMQRRGAFDYILLETTGLADPGNLAPIFWVDEGLGSSIYLDGIVTLVDAKNLLRTLDRPEPSTVANDKSSNSSQSLTIAHMQISHADVIVLNKSDLVTSERLEAVKTRIKAINSVAKLHITSHSKVPQLEKYLLDLHAYDSANPDEFRIDGENRTHIDPVSCIQIRVRK